MLNNAAASAAASSKPAHKSPLSESGRQRDTARQTNIKALSCEGDRQRDTAGHASYIKPSTSEAGSGRDTARPTRAPIHSETRRYRDTARETIAKTPLSESKDQRGRQTNSARESYVRTLVNETKERDKAKEASLMTVPKDDQVSSCEASGGRTTVDELLDAVRRLEEDEVFASPLTTAGSTHDHHASRHDFNTVGTEAGNGIQLRVEQNQRGVSGLLLTDEKYSSIMNYLDEVESSTRLGVMEQELLRSSSSVLDAHSAALSSAADLSHFEHASQTASEITQQIIAQKLELQDNKHKVQLLKKALGEQRELSVRNARESESETKRKLHAQTAEHEEAVKRHLVFIDQLIDDKKALSEKCEQLLLELKTTDKKYQDKMKNLVINHEVELRKLKEVNAAMEKLRREKWIDEKTKKIKEMTVKGLEPEIQRLIAQHKQELKQLKSAHAAELLVADEHAGQRYVSNTDALRDELAREQEVACARERKLTRKTCEQQVAQTEARCAAQVQGLSAEVQELRDRLAQASEQHRAELEQAQRSGAQRLREEHARTQAEQQQQHALEVKQLRDKLGAEKASWQAQLQQSHEASLEQREKELKERLRRDRNKEIELAINRLEEDNQAARNECERIAENKIKRIRDKCEEEVAELERSERNMSEKYNQIKGKMSEIEGNYERLKVAVKQKDMDIEDLKSLLAKRNEERDQISDVIRQEFVDKLVAADEETRRMKNEIAELKARQRIELQRAKADIEMAMKSKDEELEQVHSRVKEAIVKKEEVMAQLRQQCHAAVKRADHLEGLLQQQRNQLLAGAK